MSSKIRTAIVATTAIVMLATASFATAAPSPPATAKATWIANGSPASPILPLAPGTPGNVWDNGAADGVNGLSSERDTAITGTGGPTGQDGSGVADDFQLTAQTSVTEIRVCLITVASTLAHLTIYTDAGGTPTLPVTAPLWGAPTTAAITTSTYNDNTARCANAFGSIGREFVFSPATTGVTISLTPGHYWLLVVGDGQGNGGDRDFWATSGPATPLADGVFGSTFFGATYWTDASLQIGGTPQFAFDIDGTQKPPVPAPTLSFTSLVLLALVLAGLGWYTVRRRRQSAA